MRPHRGLSKSKLEKKAFATRLPQGWQRNEDGLSLPNCHLSIGWRDGQVASEGEDRSALDFLLIHDARSQG